MPSRPESSVAYRSRPWWRRHTIQSYRMWKLAYRLGLTKRMTAHLLPLGGLSMGDIEPILDRDLHPVDPFRYCAHCGIDCYHPWAENGSHDYDPDVEHKLVCLGCRVLNPEAVDAD